MDKVKAGWGKIEPNTQTIIAIVVIAVIILIILVIVRKILVAAKNSSRDSNSDKSRSDSDSSRSRDKRDGHNHSAPRAAAAGQNGPIQPNLSAPPNASNQPIQEGKPNPRSAQQPNPAPQQGRPEPNRVAGSAGIVQPTCGGGDCAGNKANVQQPETPRAVNRNDAANAARVHAQNRPVFSNNAQANSHTQVNAHHQDNDQDDDGEEVDFQVQNSGHVHHAGHTHHPQFGQNIMQVGRAGYVAQPASVTERFAEHKSQKKVEASVPTQAPPSSRYTPKNDD